ncbi:right-handed parallel beta-helix repeat-containing protein [Aureliella helgolandensis]|uniref:Pectate lyase superfamily protein n=1 Tax=Aureliella helgolandensis TaxID=2527968 RepID=A0A518GFP3_9BACT|nr:right-handed parallel beta-helix repeat-containing protein [Aureliella helgolandensis]QDV27422.1 Pectate lyase superfamily protein [Aureliella helgolandensis]
MQSMLKPCCRLYFLVACSCFLSLLRPVDGAERVGVGDGVADDTQSLQRAVDSGVGNLELPAGTYRITRPIVIDLAKVGHTSISGGGAARILMAGPGPALEFIGTHAGTADPSTVKADVWKREDSPMVDGLKIVGGHPEACGIRARGTLQLTLTRLVIRKVLHAVHLTQRNRNVTLSECHLYENQGVGLFLDQLNLHQINVANCHISYNRGGGIVAKQSEIRNLQIGTCDIEGNMAEGDAPPTANIWLDATNSSLGEVAIVGCTIQHSHEARGSANIRINCQSVEVAFTKETRHGNITIADNVLSDVEVNVELHHVRGATISGNTIWKGYQKNLILEDCRNIVLANNVFDRNPRYGYGGSAQAKLGVLITNSADCTLSGNHGAGRVDGEAAVVVRNCERMNISGWTLLDYGSVGLLLDNVTRSRVSGCLIRDDVAKSPGLAVSITGRSEVQVDD